MSKKTLISLSIIAAVVAVGVGSTIAYFSDSETSSGNTFAAGEIDLKIDNESYYNGEFSSSTSWELTDLTVEKFFNFDDLKPGDWGEDTISIHIENNDAWLCADIKITENDDNSSNEPELEAGDDEEDPDDNFDGELAQSLEFVFWADDGDNVLEESEMGSVIAKGLANTIIGDELNVALADSRGGLLGGDPLSGDTTFNIGKAWCFGNLELAPVVDGNNSPTVDPGITCDGSLLGNMTQSDSLMGDVTFRAIQSRHNLDFVCGDNGIGCLEEADVILTLDRSGSIDSSEMAVLKTAAIAFVDALNPSADGVHMGEVSFASFAVLDQVLTDSAALVIAAINALAPGGNTNLEDAIQKSEAELESTRDRDDNDAPDYMVIITDGNPTASNSGGDHSANAAAAATAAKAKGITIYVVGIGGDVNATYLETQISSGSGYYYGAVTWPDLENILESIANCD